MSRGWSTPDRALAFVQTHGIVLESGRGPVPSLAEAIAGEPIAGSWWGHSKKSVIFRATRTVRDSPDILVCRVIGGKITYIHRRLWPALLRLAPGIECEHLAAIQEEHTSSGAHRLTTTAFPRWVPAEVETAAAKLTEAEARAQIGDWSVPAPDAGHVRRGRAPRRSR